MRIASALGGLAFCAAVFLFFYRFWGLPATPVQITILIAAPPGRPYLDVRRFAAGADAVQPHAVAQRVGRFRNLQKRVGDNASRPFFLALVSGRVHVALPLARKLSPLFRQPSSAYR